MKRIHFHSIDALRFFAFLKVYFLHVPIDGSFPIFSFFKSGGGIGVSFFFVLSGFLITYLLVKEKLNKPNINLKRFFVNRVLRIWPLFYLMVILVFLLPFDFKQEIGFHMCGGGYDLDWKYSFTFLENYKMLMTDMTPKTTPLPVFWSLCIEEHFYIFWMFALFLIPKQHIFKFFVSCFFIAWTARFFEPYIFGNAHIETSELFTNLDYFASGGLLGYWVAKDFERVSNFILKIPDWIKWNVLWLIVLFVIFQKQLLPYEPGTTFFIFRSTIVALVFTLLIALFIPVDSKIRIKSKLLSYLGVRSYGLYVYHIIFVHISYQYCMDHQIKIDDSFVLSLFIFITLGASIITSIVSFKYFEKPILSLKYSDKLNRYLEPKV